GDLENPRDDWPLHFQRLPYLADFGCAQNAVTLAFSAGLWNAVGGICLDDLLGHREVEDGADQRQRPIRLDPGTASRNAIDQRDYVPPANFLRLALSPCRQ